MKKINFTRFMPGLLFLLASCSNKPSLKLDMSDKFEGQPVEIINYLDSATLASAVIDGSNQQLLTVAPDTPVFATIMIEGRIRGYYISEPGTATFNDSLSVAKGTPLNDKFALLLSQLDSIEMNGTMNQYMEFVEEKFNENRNNPIGSYFGIEWLRYADPSKVDSFINAAPQNIKDSYKTTHYYNLAELRLKTSPGSKYVDFSGENKSGEPVELSSLMKPGNYTLIDFWASWCPYCIKELPKISQLYKSWGEKGLEIIGVAVRDVPDETKAAVIKHNMTWPILYNTQRVPYDIYGFTGIPYHMLIAPDGTIVSRGGSISEIEEYLISTFDAQSSLE